MSSFMRVRNSWLSMPKHASEDELLLYVDGELKPRQAEWVRKHLEACWECRTRCEQTGHAISDFVEYRRVSLGSRWEGPPRGWPSLRPRLNRLVAKSGSEAVSSALNLSPRLSPGFVCAVLMCLAAAVLWQLTTVSTVSAKELLTRAANAELEGIRRVQRPVIHQKFTVCRRSGTGSGQAGTLEIWSDVEGAQVKRQGSDSLWQELQQVFQASGVGSVRPLLSAAVYRSWQDSVSRKREEVLTSTLADGTKVWTLLTVAEGPFIPQGITLRELTVRARDWHPIRETFRIQGAAGSSEYEITEIASDVVTRNSLPPDLFAERPVFVPQLGMPRPAAPPAAVAPVPTVSVVQDEFAEWKAVYALHRLGACRGEAIEVVRETTGEIVVRGVAETVRRKSELLQALEMVPGLRIQIRTAEEARETGPTLEPERNAAVIVKTPPMPIGDELVKYFAQQADSASASSQVAAFSDEAVSLARDLLADAWALRRLAERFPTGGSQTEPPWRLAEEMARDHVASLQSTLARTRGLLAPVLASVAQQAELAEGATQAVGVESDWRGACLDVFHRVERIYTLVNGLLAGAGEIGEPAPAAAELLTAFSQAQKQLMSTDALAARGFGETAGLRGHSVAKK